MISVQRSFSILSSFLLSQCLIEDILTIESMEHLNPPKIVTMVLLFLSALFIILGELRGNNFLEYFKFFDQPVLKALLILMVSGSIYAKNEEGKSEIYTHYSMVLGIIGGIMLVLAPCSRRQEYKRGKRLV